MEKKGYICSSWGRGNTAPRDVRVQEQALESVVSAVIGDMPFLWLAIEDEPGPGSLRGYIERNAIALLSNFAKPHIDVSSHSWLGQYCDRDRVQRSGLWNSNHVDEIHEPAFLETMARLIGRVGRQP